LSKDHVYATRPKQDPHQQLMTTEQLSIKVKFGEDLRRFCVRRDITFIDLVRFITQQFGFDEDQAQLKYIDDEEELITLGSDLELSEAIRLQPSVLRLNASVKQSKKSYKLEAAIVRPVTIADNSSVTAGVKFTKTWCIKNTGSQPWPVGTTLKMVDPKDDQLVVLAAGRLARPIVPGEETELSVELQAPTRPGRCVQHWRLFTMDDEAFGRRFWMDINVTLPAIKEQDATGGRKEDEEERLRRKKDAEEARRRQEEEEEEARRRQEEMLRRQNEEEAGRRQEKMLRRQKEEEEAHRRREEMLRRLREEEEEARKRQEEEEMFKRLIEGEAKRKLEAEARIKHEREERRKMILNKCPQMVALEEMGFTDIEHNWQLFQTHSSNFDAVLEALLSGQ